MSINKVKIQTFNFDDCVGEIYKVNNSHYQLKGTYTGSGNPMMLFWAASPPNYIQSFNGSGLPFPNAQVAYEGTPNHKKVQIDDMMQFDIKFVFPNAYYHDLGRVYVPPHINFVFGINGVKHTIYLNEDIPARSLSVSLFNAVV